MSRDELLDRIDAELEDTLTILGVPADRRRGEVTIATSEQVVHVSMLGGPWSPPRRASRALGVGAAW